MLPIVVRGARYKSDGGFLKMRDHSLLKMGIIGMVVVGLSALTGYLDSVLFPALAFFIALSGYAVWRNRKTENLDSNENEGKH